MHSVLKERVSNKGTMRGGLRVDKETDDVIALCESASYSNETCGN